MLTEDQIERRAEAKIDRLDRQLLNGQLTQADYDAACLAVDDWTERQYRALDAERQRQGERFGA